MYGVRQNTLLLPGTPEKKGKEKDGLREGRRNSLKTFQAEREFKEYYNFLILAVTYQVKSCLFRLVVSGRLKFTTVNFVGSFQVIHDSFFFSFFYSVLARDPVTFSSGNTPL